MWILYHYLPKKQPLFSQNRKRKITHVLIAICNAHLVAKYSTMTKQKSVPKARRTKQIIWRNCNRSFFILA